MKNIALAECDLDYYPSFPFTSLGNVRSLPSPPLLCNPLYFAEICDSALMGKQIPINEDMIAQKVKNPEQKELVFLKNEIQP